MINKIKDQIEKNLEIFMKNAEKRYRLKDIDPRLHQSIQKYNLRKGKRIRPLLFILSYNGYIEKGARVHSSIYKTAIAIELLHNFMLIHDDIIDRSDLRRGRPTMHKMLEKSAKTKEQKKLGCDLAIIAGDLIYAFALEAFLEAKVEKESKEQALKFFVETTALTAIGEYIDTLHGVLKLADVKEKDVYLNYSYKTARYTFIAPMVIGALLAKADKTEIKKLSEIGMLIGQAFQIQDDIIGIFDTQKNIGKSILTDLAESKKTLLVSKAFEKLTASKKKEFITLFDKPKKGYKDLQRIRKIFTESRSLEFCLGEIESRTNQAMKIFDRTFMKNNSRKLIKTALGSLFRQSEKIKEQYKISTRSTRSHLI